MKTKLSTPLRMLSVIALCFLIIPLIIAATSHPACAGTLAAALFPMAILREKAKEEGEGGGGEQIVDPATALKQIEDKTLPMSQRLDVAFKALKGIDPTNQLADVKQKLKDAEALIQTRDGELSTAKSETEKANKQITALQTDVSELQAANVNLEKEKKDLLAKEQDLDKRAEAKSKEKMKSLGFKANDLPAADAKLDGDKSAEDRIRALTGGQRLKAGLYFQQHKKLPDWMN